MSPHCTFNRFTDLNLSTIHYTTSLLTRLHQHVHCSIIDWEKSIILLTVVTTWWGSTDTRVIEVHPTLWLNLALSHLLPVLFLTGTLLTVALTWTACSTSIQGTVLCFCWEAWTEKRPLGTIFQSLPLSSVSLAGGRTICGYDVMYWCGVKMYVARVSSATVSHSHVSLGGIQVVCL